MTEPVVLIISCDQFSDCHPATLACLERYWPDCPYEIRTMSNEKPWGKSPLLVGPDTSWTNKLMGALDMLGAELVITTLEDMLLSRPVDTAAVRTAVDFMRRDEDIGAVRLGQGAEKVDSPGFDFQGIPFDPISRDSDYRISTSPTLWRSAYLRKILGHCGETAWSFEQNGTQYAQSLPEEVWTIHGDSDVHRPIRCYYTAITRSRWDPRCIAWLKTLGIEVEDTSRGFMEV